MNIRNRTAKAPKVFMNIRNRAAKAPKGQQTTGRGEAPAKKRVATLAPTGRQGQQRSFCHPVGVGIWGGRP